MPALVVLAFLLIPLAEIYAIIQVGHAIGAGWTILLLIADSVLGAWLVKREGRRAWAALQQSLHAGRMPGKELADGALVLVGGTLLLTPGFLTDAVGFFLLLPFTRPLARRLLIAFASRWFGRAVAAPGGRPGGIGVHFHGGPGGPADPRGYGPPRPGKVVPGSVVKGSVVDGGTEGRDDDEGPKR